MSRVLQRAGLSTPVTTVTTSLQDVHRSTIYANTLKTNKTLRVTMSMTMFPGTLAILPTMQLVFGFGASTMNIYNSTLLLTLASTQTIVIQVLITSNQAGKMNIISDAKSTNGGVAPLVNAVFTEAYNVDKPLFIQARLASVLGAPTMQRLFAIIETLD